MADEQVLLDDSNDLPLCARVTHANWKVRSAAYVHIKAECDRALSPEDPVLDSIAPFVSKGVADSNAAAADTALDALQAYLTVGGEQHAAKVVDKACFIITSKCFSARPGTVARATSVLLLFVELDQGHKVVESLVLAFAHKSPKVANTALEVLLDAIRMFGTTVLSPHPILKALPPVFDSRDARTRSTAKDLVGELARWVGPDFIRTQLFEKLRDAIREDVDRMLQEMDTTQPVAARCTRSDLAALAQAAESVASAKTSMQVDAAAVGHAMEANIQPVMDAYDFAEPKNIMNELMKGWWDAINCQKWSVRKAALTQLKELASYPKLHNSDYGDLNRELRKIIMKDNNMAVSAEGVACVGALSKGLRGAFSAAAKQLVGPLLEKFKEKNSTMTMNTTESLKAMLTYSITIAEVQEEVTAALLHSNPRVREETLKLLTVCLAMETKQTMSKHVPSILVTAAKNTYEATPSLREAALEYLVEFAVRYGSVSVLDKATSGMDDLRKKRLADLVHAAKGGGPSATASRQLKPAPTPAPRRAAQAVSATKLMTAPPVTASLVLQSQAVAGQHAPAKLVKQIAARQVCSQPTGGGIKVSSAASPGCNSDGYLASVDKGGALQQLCSVLGDSIVAKLQDSSWKVRQEAMEQLAAQTYSLTQHCTVFMRALPLMMRDERNFQVQAKQLEVFRILAVEAPHFSKRDAGNAVSVVIDKIADVKLKSICAEALISMSEAVGPGFISTELHNKAVSHKNPKVCVETINWISAAIESFGLQAFDTKALLDWVKLDLGSSQAAVRTAAVNLFAAMYRFVGRPLLDMLGTDLKPMLLSVIEEAVSRTTMHSGFRPSRFVRSLVPCASVIGQVSTAGATCFQERSSDFATDMDHCLPRADISVQLDGVMMSNLMSSNWKERKAALDSVEQVVKAAGNRIQPQVGDLFNVLKHRVGDTNKNLVVQTLQLLGKLAVAIGKPMDRVGKAILAPCLKNMSDSKQLVRAAVWEMMDAWARAASVETLFAEVADIMAEPKCSADGRKDALTWISKQVCAGVSGDSLTYAIKAAAIGTLEKASTVREAAAGLISLLLQEQGAGRVAQACQGLDGSYKKSALEALSKANGGAIFPCVLMTAPATLPALSKSSGKSRGTRQATREQSSNNLDKAKSISLCSQSNVVPSNLLKSRAGLDTVNISAHVADEGPVLRFDDKKEERAKKAKFKSTRFEVQQDEMDVLLEQLGRIAMPSLKALLFHKDFKKHCEAVDMLQTSLPGLGHNLMSCVDLIFRWAVLRIAEGNTQSLVAALSLVKSIFDYMLDHGIRLSDYEAKLILPCLVEKCGHNNDRIKLDFRELLRKACELHPPSKVFSIVRDGLESKNNRTKVECADELGQIIHRAGAKVYASSRQHEVLQTMARMVSERDGAVRKAVLSTMEILYTFEGDGIWKFLGRLTEQQKDLIEERLKFVDKDACKRRTISGLKCTSTEAHPSAVQMTSMPSSTDYSHASGNHELHNRLKTCGQSKVQQAKSVESATLWSASTPCIQAPHPSSLLNTSASPVMGKLSDEQLKDDIGHWLQVLSANDVPEAVEVMKLLCYQLMDYERLSQQGKVLFALHVDDLVHHLSSKTHVIFSTAAACVSVGTAPNSRACKYSLNSLMQVFQNSSLAMNLTEHPMMELMSVLLLLLVDERLPNLPEGDALLKALNVLMLKILENTNRDCAFGALLQLLRVPHAALVTSQERAALQPRWNDLVVKCLIKITKVLPQTIESSDVPRLLLNIHMFFDMMGQDEIRARGARDDRPLRMVKTLLHEVCKLKGFNVYKYLGAIPQSQEPRPIIFPYIDLNLQTLVSSGIIEAVSHSNNQSSSTTIGGYHNGNESTMGAPAGSPQRQHLASVQEARNVLATIFKRIGDKNEPDKALTELHYFLLEHQEVDINQYLSAASEQFRVFINKGLARIQTKLATRRDARPVSAGLTLDEPSIGELQHRMQRMRKAQLDDSW